MKSTLLATLCVATLAWANPGALNFAKINEQLARSVEQVLNEKDKALGKFFPRAAWQISEAGTDLVGKEKLRIQSKAQLTAVGPAWHPTGEVTLETTLTGEANLVDRSASVEGSAALQTPTQKLLTFVANLVAPYFCEAKEPSTLDLAVCRELKSVAAATDLTALFERIVRLQGLHTTWAKAELTRAQAELASAPPDKKAYWEKREREAREEYSASHFVQLAFREALAKGMASEKFSVKLRDLNFFTTTELREFDLFLSATQLDLGVKLTQTDIKDMVEYVKRRDQIAEGLLKLQNDDPETVETARNSIRTTLETLRNWIGPKN